jgi:enoyl-CoA hydratase/carnithine racemase
MHFESYKDKFRNIALSRDNGVLDMRLHTNDGPLQWGIDEGCVHGQLGDAFYCIGRDRSNKVVVMRGTGEEYCTARNLAEFKDLESDDCRDRLIREGRDILINQMDIEAPIISIVNGPAMIHPELPLMADIVLAAPTARFRDSHVTSNLVPGDGGQIFWTSVLGPTRASYFFLTQETLTAEDGVRFGFVHEIVVADKLLLRATELAGHLASKSQSALRYTRMVVHQALRNRFATEAGYGFIAEMLSMSSKEGKHELDPNRLKSGKV